MGEMDGTGFESLALHSLAMGPRACWATPLSLSCLICEQGKVAPKAGRSWR